MTRKELYFKVSEDLGIPVEVIALAYASIGKFIYNKTLEMDLSSISEEDFKNLRTNFNLPGIGKLYTNWDRVVGARKRSEYLKNLKDGEST